MSSTICLIATTRPIGIWQHNDSTMGKSVFLWLCIILFLGFTPHAYSNGLNVNIEGHVKPTMKTIPPDFEKVDLGSFKESLCTPQKIWPPDGRPRGIWIAAPTKVITNGDYQFPLCGSWLLSTKYLNKFRNLELAMTTVVVDAATHKSYSDNFADKQFDMIYYDRTPTSGTDEELEDWTEGGWFNIDVFRYVPSLPKRPGKFIVYVLLGEQKSNVVNVEVVDKE